MTTLRLNQTLAKARRSSLGATALQALSFIILHQGRSTLTDIARHLEFTTAAVTHLADKLEKLGFVNRQRDPSDRRTIHLQITPLGTSTVQAITSQTKPA